MRGAIRPQIGELVKNKYRLVRLLGDGGMGSVYEALHEGLGTRVALKFLHIELSRRSNLMERFLREAKVSASIQNRHVVQVMDVDRAPDGVDFIVMEFLEGRTLQAHYEDLYRAGVRLPYDDAIDFAMQMIEGVSAAHEAGVVHRDLKPDNVMITRTARGDPLLKLLDFGIAKLRMTGEFERGLTRPGVIMGTPEYMAPEQAYSADAVDGRADIFSLGVLMFEMLAGQRPVGGDDPRSIAQQYLAGEAARLDELAPQVVPELAVAVHRAMAPLAKDRFQTVGELHGAIAPFARVSGTSSKAHSLGPTPAPSVRVSQAIVATPPTNIAEEPDEPVAKTVYSDATLFGEPPPTDPDAQPLEQDPPTPLGGFMVTGVGDTPPPVENAGPPVLPPVEPPAASMRQPASVVVRSPPDATIEAAPLSATIGEDPTLPADRDRSSTAPMEAFPELPPTQPKQPKPPAAAPPPSSRQLPAPRRTPARSGGSLALILLLAAGIAAAVVGGVYIAQQSETPEERRPPRAPPTRSTGVRTPPPRNTGPKQRPPRTNPTNRSPGPAPAPGTPPTSPPKYPPP